MNQTSQKKALSNLKQAEGMIKKVRTMLEEGKYCIDILQQSLAAIGFIKSTNKTILENHLNCCFKNGMLEKDPVKQDKLVKEVIRIMNKI